MADRYWVGGPGWWYDSTNHWTTVDGGGPAPGLTPEPGDNAYFTYSSGLTSSDTIVIDTPEIYDLNIHIGGGNFSLAQDLICHDLSVGGVTFDANDFNVTASSIEFRDSSENSVLYMGNGTWTATTGGFSINEGDGPTVDVHCELSTLDVQGGNFYAGLDKVYNIVILSTPSSTHEVNWSCTIADFRIVDHPMTVNFMSWQSFTFGSFTANGASGELITIGNTGIDSFIFFLKTSGIVNCRYLHLTDNVAGGGATWNAINSVNAMNNLGWNFISATDVSITDSASVVTATNPEAQGIAINTATISDQVDVIPVVNPNVEILTPTVWETKNNEDTSWTIDNVTESTWVKTEVEAVSWATDQTTSSDWDEIQDGSTDWTT
jgi:hypothetical protein